MSKKLACHISVIRSQKTQKTHMTNYQHYEYDFVQAIDEPQRFELFTMHVLREHTEENFCFLLCVDALLYASQRASKWLQWVETSYTMNTGSKHKSEWTLSTCMVHVFTKLALVVQNCGMSSPAVANSPNASPVPSPEDEPSPLPRKRKNSKLFSLERPQKELIMKKLIALQEATSIHQVVQFYYKTCTCLMELFVLESSPCEVNINDTARRETIAAWQRFVKLYDKVSVNVNTVQNIMADSLLLFNHCYTQVEYIMHRDVFGRFKRSACWKKHIESMTDSQVCKFARTKSIQEIEPYLMNVADMQRHLLLPKDIALAKLLVMDYYHWEPFYASKKRNVQIYSSAIQLLKPDAIKKYGYMHAYKMTCDFDCSAHQLMNMFTTKQYYMRLSGLEDLQVVGYVAPKLLNEFCPRKQYGYLFPTMQRIRAAGDVHFVFQSSNSDPNLQWLHKQGIFTSLTELQRNQQNRTVDHLGCIILYESKNMGSIIFREFVQTSTVYYDVAERTLLRIFKYCEHPDLPAVKSGYVRGISYGCMAVTDLGHGKCRYNAIFTVNLRGIFENKSEHANFLSKQGIRSHLKNTVKHFAESVHQCIELGDAQDDMHMMRSMYDYAQLLS